MLACTVRTSSPPLFCHHFTFPISFLYLSSPPQSFGCPRLAFNWLFFVERAMITYQALTRPFGCLSVSPPVPRPPPPGLPIHFSAGEQQQRADPTDQQRHQERPVQPQPHLHVPGSALHRQRWQQGDGRGLRRGDPSHPRGRVSGPRKAQGPSPRVRFTKT